MEDSEERRGSSARSASSLLSLSAFFLTPMASHALTGSRGPGPSLFCSGLSGTLRGRLMDKERVQVRECRDGHPRHSPGGSLCRILADCGALMGPV